MQRPSSYVTLASAPSLLMILICAPVLLCRAGALMKYNLNHLWSPLHAKELLRRSGELVQGQPQDDVIQKETSEDEGKEPEIVAGGKMVFVSRLELLERLAHEAGACIDGNSGGRGEGQLSELTGDELKALYALAGRAIPADAEEGATTK